MGPRYGTLGPAPLSHDMRNEVEAELVSHGRGNNGTKLDSMLLRGASRSRKGDETSRR